MKRSRTGGSWSPLTLTNVLRQLLSMETPRALHHHRGHHTVEDGQHLRAGSSAEERLQVLDARDVCARAVSSRTLVDLGVLMKTHNL